MVVLIYFFFFFFFQTWMTHAPCTALFNKLKSVQKIKKPIPVSWCTIQSGDSIVLTSSMATFATSTTKRRPSLCPGNRIVYSGCCRRARRKQDEILHLRARIVALEAIANLTVTISSYHYMVYRRVGRVGIGGIVAPVSLQGLVAIPGVVGRGLVAFEEDKKAS
jgi:hypothetical protein